MIDLRLETRGVNHVGKTIRIFGANEDFGDEIVML